MSTANETRTMVRDAYARVVEKGSGCCSPAAGCGGDAAVSDYAKSIGYKDSDLDMVPEGANLGLGCGNPTALAELRPGDVVLDLGAGAGLDALIAAKAVGPEGRVIGVDMTPQMLSRARENAVKAGYAATVEFREGVIEDLPVTDESVDVVISNCVINLSPDKAQVFREAYRVLKRGGRLAVSDIILSEALPEEIRADVDAYCGCVAGALVEADYLDAIRAAGFDQIEWTRVEAAALLESVSDPTLDEVVAGIGAKRLAAIADTIFSYQIRAVKP